MTRRLLFLALLVCAQPLPAAESTYQQGLDAFRDGDYSAALEAFQRAQDAGKDTPQLHYNLGVTHYRLGQLDQADAAFARAAEGPDLQALALYNRGRVATRDNRPDDATDLYRAARDAARTDQVHDLAKAALDAQAEARDEAREPQRPGPTVLAELGLGYDSNTALQGEERPNGDRGDSFAELLLYGDLPVAGTTERGLRVHGLLNGVQHADNSEDDFDRLETGLTAFRSPGDWRQEIGANVSLARLDGERLETAMEGHGEVERALGGGLHAGLRYRLAWIDAGDAFEGLDGIRQDLRARLRGSSGAARWRADYSFEWNDRDDIEDGNGVISYSPMRHGVHARWIQPLTDQVRASVDGGARYSTYPDREDTEDGLQRREDLRFRLSGQVTRELGRGFSAFARIHWLDNRSSIERYRFARIRGGAGLEYLFH